MHLTIIGWLVIGIGFVLAAIYWRDTGKSWHHNPRRKWQERLRPLGLFLIMLGFGLAVWFHFLWAAAAALAGIFCCLLEATFHRANKARFERNRPPYLREQDMDKVA